MKIRKPTLATFTIALSVALLAVNSAQGQTTNANSPTPDPLPAELPIGSMPRMLDWVVTNRPGHVYFQISFTNSTDGYRYYGWFPFGLVRFDSYQSYTEYMKAACWYLYTNYALPRTDIVSPIGMYARFYYHMGIYTPLVLITNNVGLRGHITPDSFTDRAAIVWLSPTVLVTNLSSIVVRVDSDPPYIGSWPPPPGPGIVSPYPRELTTNGLIVLRSWYSSGTNRARFTVTAGEHTRTYTQFGTAFTNPSVQMVNNSELAVSHSAGSDTAVESTTNFVTWQTVTALPWSSNVSSVVVPVNTTPRSRFFRAYSN